mmetsp:Transcript_542/g.1836  ORF Transcript_542/g.1836 Transcript_542/m.1836 type:complete len:255 (+) Transcript_542:2523-3287(+)
MFSAGSFISIEHMMALMLPVTVPTRNFFSSVWRSLTFPEKTEISKTDVRFIRAVPMTFPPGERVGWASKYTVPLWTWTTTHCVCRAVRVPLKRKGSTPSPKLVQFSFSFPGFFHLTTTWWRLFVGLEAFVASACLFLGTMNLRHLLSLSRPSFNKGWFSASSRVQFSNCSWKSKTSSQLMVKPSMATSDTATFLPFFRFSSCSFVSFAFTAKLTLASFQTIFCKERSPLPMYVLNVYLDTLHMATFNWYLAKSL